jgi:CSLREA domain-containing protein
MSTNRRSRVRAALFGTLLVCLSAAPVRAASPAIFAVTSAGDAGGATCSATCTLRQAINAANANVPATDTITFAVPGGPATIVPSSPLPTVTDTVVIDGTSQPGTKLLGSNAGTGANGLLVQASFTVIKGLSISAFSADGIRLDGVHGAVIGGNGGSDGNTLTANGGDGITLVGDSTAVGNAFIGNSIDGNGSLAIDLGDDDRLGLVGNSVGGPPIGPNGLLNGPRIDELVAPVTDITIHPDRAASGGGRVDVYWSPTCPADFAVSGFRIPQAAVYLGSVVPPIVSGLPTYYGDVTFTLPVARSSGFITATSTAAEGTSEVGLCEMIAAATDLTAGASVAPAGPIPVGSTVHVDMAVGNLGPVTNTDPFAGLIVTAGSATFSSIASSRGPCFVVDGTGACELGEFAVGATADVHADLIVTTAGEVDIDALVLDPKNLDPNPANNTVTLSLDVVADEATSGTVGPGGSISSDAESDGATPGDPLETSISLPVGGNPGTVTIAERADSGPPPVGYSFFGQASVITAPPQTAARPLTLTFAIDGTAVPAQPLVVFRNGVPVAACAVANPATDPSATPDPCYLPPQTVGDDLVITVRTSAASTWRVGTRLPFHFAGFFAPVDNGGVLNQVKAGQAIPVKFSLGGDQGLGIFVSGSPSSGGVACGTARVDPIEQTVTAGSSSLSYDAASGRYQYVWKSDKAWAGTCRRLTLSFQDGSTQTALFQFVK